MAHVTTPRWLSPISRRIAVIVIAAAAALMLITSIVIPSASAADPVLVQNVNGDACRALGFGVDAFNVVIQRAGGQYSRTLDLPNGGKLTLSAPANRSRVDFSITGATADGGILFNRTDQKEGNLYDYRPEGGATQGTLAPPPRDQGNDKLVVFCFGVSSGIDIDVTTSGSNDGGTYSGPGDGVFITVGDTVTWTYTVTNTGDVPLTSVAVTDSNPGVTPTFSSGDTNGNNQLDLTEIWVWTATGEAVESEIGVPYTNTGNVTAFFGPEQLTASDGSSYFGAAPDISVVATTSGSNSDGVYAGPGDGVYIKAGDTVTWTYEVKNEGNVTLTNVGVTDTNVTGITCSATTLAPGASTTCSATGTAEESEIGVWFTNTGTASGTPPVGLVVTDSDGSSYFGYVASLSITATLNGVAVPVAEGESNPVVSSAFEWIFTITNTGNVGVDGVVVTEDGTELVCEEGALGTIPPGSVSGNPAECTVKQNAPGDLADPEVTTSFTVTGDDPNGNETSDTTGPITYFVGFDCGDDTVSGGPDLTDNPLAGFYVGPLKETASECAVPVFIDTTNTLNEANGQQTVFIGPPDGYNWDGVTGLLTVEWDVEDPADAGVRPTFQDTVLGVVEIPICGGDVAVSINAPSGTDFFYTLNDNPTEANGTYPLATGGGDICLVLHMTKTIDYIDGSGPAVKTITVEVFYIYNDPQLIRPR